MDYVTRQFINLVKRFRKELPKLAESVHRDLEQHARAICTTQERDEQQRNVQPIWLEPAISKYQESIADKQANDERQYRVQNSIRLAAWGAFIAATFYGGVSVLQWQTARESVKLISNQFQLDRRPLVSVDVEDLHAMDLTGKDLTDHPVIGQLIAVNVHFTNIGKSAATDLVLHKHLLFGKNASEVKQEPLDERGIGANVDEEKGAFATVISSKDTYRNESVVYDRDEALVWDGSYPIIVFGRVTYGDTFGNRYCAPYLYSYLATSQRFAVASGSNVARLCPDDRGIPP